MKYNKIIKAKKSLGQNFLKSKSVLNRIIQEGEISEKDIILEIGPGKGALTEKLLEHARCVVAIEKDRELVVFLKEKFKKEIENKKLILIEGDCLEFEFPLSLPRRESERGSGIKNLPSIPSLVRRGGNTTYKLIANIPYNITGAILKKFLSEDTQPERMVLLVQKEVCDRIMARDQKESILSVSVKAYGIPKYVMKVDKKLFSPSPKVDSAILSIKNISKKNFEFPLSKNLPSIPSLVRRGGNAFEEEFFKILKTGFAHKRKVLIKNLEQVCEREKLEEIFKSLNIDIKTRAENLSTDTWIKLTKSIFLLY